MPLSDIFTTPFLICLGISILLIGLLGMYFTQKTAEQNHKISSMFELVSTMAQELNFIRSNLLVSPQFRQQVSSVVQPSIVNQNVTKENLIPVSDDDDDEDNNDSDSDSDSDDASDDASDENSDNELEETSKIKSISLEPANDVLQTLEILEEDGSDDDDDDDNDDESVETYDDANDVAEDHGNENVKVKESDDNLEVFSNLNFEKFANEEDTNIQVKKLAVSDLDQHKAVDYKKLSLAKLREIALEKGGIEASKMKKADLLNLLLSS